MYKKILIPIDDSPASLAALYEACKIAKHSSGMIHMVHILDFSNFNQGGIGYIQSVVGYEEVKAEGEKILNHAKKIAEEQGVKFDTEILEGLGDKVSKLLVTEASKQNCDVIVMGTHGRAGVMHLLMGSVAEGVLRQANIPVLLIRKST
jgi:nucleotide-binding universal stress UspA family protein